MVGMRPNRKESKTMKTSFFRIVTLSAICASLIGMSALASADGWNRKIERKISNLQVAKDRAIAHHHRGKAHEIQAQIDALRAQLHHRH